MRMRALIAMLAGFFVMGFCDIIGTVMSQVKAECRLPDAAAGFLPSMAFVWFFVISIPTGILCSKVGRKNTVLVALAVTFVAMLLPQVSGAENWWLYAAAFGTNGMFGVLIFCTGCLLALGIFVWAVERNEGT